MNLTLTKKTDRQTHRQTDRGERREEGGEIEEQMGT